MSISDKLKSFSKDYTEYIKMKWTSVNPSIVDLIIQDTIKFVQKYFKR